MARHFIYHSAPPEDVLAMGAFFASLRPANNEQRHPLATARDLFGTIVETQLTMIRSPVDRVPNLLINPAIDAVTVILAAPGARAVASAVFLILELSHPYSGVFRMPREGFDERIKGFSEYAVTAAE